MSCTKITDQGMIATGQLRLLKRLEVKDLTSISANTFVQIFQSTKQLEVVNISQISNITDEVIEQLCLSSGNSLITLNLQQCTNFSDKGLKVSNLIP
jgi:hypothetical protein